MDTYMTIYKQPDHVNFQSQSYLPSLRTGYLFFSSRIQRTLMKFNANEINNKQLFKNVFIEYAVGNISQGYKIQRQPYT